MPADAVSQPVMISDNEETPDGDDKARSDDPAVRELLNRPFAGSAACMAAMLFGGDRWRCVRDVALALDGQQPSGIATLAPRDELGGSGAHIIGVWGDPSYRRQRIGMTLLRAQRDRRLTLYHKVPTVVAITTPICSGSVTREPTGSYRSSPP